MAINSTTVMAVKFITYDADTQGKVNIITNEAEVSEDVFWRQVREKIQQLTAHLPDQEALLFERVKQAIETSGKHVTIIDKAFQIKLVKEKKNNGKN